MASERSRFMVQITCPHCGQSGTMVWEEDDGHTPGPRKKRALVMATGFHAENSRTRSGDPVIVCDACDQIQAD
jgi:phage terminase large subunit GpA-like protein